MITIKTHIFIPAFSIIAICSNIVFPKSADSLKNDPNWKAYTKEAIELGSLFSIPEKVLKGHFLNKYKDYDCFESNNIADIKNADTTFYYDIGDVGFLNLVKSASNIPLRYNIMIKSQYLDKMLGILLRSGFTGEADWKKGKLTKGNVLVYYGKLERLPANKCIKGRFRLYPTVLQISPIRYPMIKDEKDTTWILKSREKRICGTEGIYEDVARNFSEVFGSNIEKINIHIELSPDLDAFINPLSKDTLKYGIEKAATFNESNLTFWETALYRHIIHIERTKAGAPKFVCGCKPHRYDINIAFANKREYRFIFGRCSISMEFAEVDINDIRYRICFDENGISLIKDYLSKIRLEIFGDSKGCCGD